MNKDFPLLRIREAMEKWAEGEAETNMPFTASSFNIVSSEVVAFTCGNFPSISRAFLSDATQTYFNGTPR
jgi:hypothetical protein